MLRNNAQRWKIWKSIEDPFDYITFKAKCEEVMCDDIDEITFARQIGMFLYTEKKFPELHPVDAYARFFGEVMQDPATINQPVSGVVTSCCGGGQVK